MCKGRASHSHSRPSTEGARCLLMGPGGVVVRLQATIVPTFLFTLVCQEARKKISSCKALNFQKLCCLMPLSVVSLLLPSSMHTQNRACRAAACGRQPPLPGAVQRQQEHPYIPGCRRARVTEATRRGATCANSQVEKWAGKSAGRSATVPGEICTCSHHMQPSLCDTVVLHA